MKRFWILLLIISGFYIISCSLDLVTQIIITVDAYEMYEMYEITQYFNTYQLWTYVNNLIWCVLRIIIAVMFFVLALFILCKKKRCSDNIDDVNQEALVSAYTKVLKDEREERQKAKKQVKLDKLKEKMNKLESGE